MRKLVILASILTVLYYCSPKQEKVERYMEDGVEVIVNHLEPYKIKGEPSTLHLEEEFSIDIEKDAIANLGLYRAWGFDVDSEGNIYIFNSPLIKDNLVFKFDKNGKFITSFGRTGQGPGEVQLAAYQRITENDEIPIVDVRGHKLLIFNKYGDPIRENRIDSNLSSLGDVIPLANGKFLIRRGERIPAAKYWRSILCLYNSEFKEIKVLDTLTVPSDEQERIYKFPFKVHIWRISDEKIYVGNEERGYEIWVFDFEGNLLRKIKKEYRRVEISENIKSTVRRMISDPRSYWKTANISKHWPPFQHFFTDDKGRLFVQTSEKGENQKEYVLDSDHPMEYIYDIFNSNGIFIGKKNLRVYIAGVFYWVTVRKDRFYCLQEKESGYKKLVVYMMRWE